MVLNESSRDNLLQPYVDILKSKGIETNVSQLKQFLLAKFVNEAYIRNLSLDSNYYLAGVARYYFEGKLTLNKRLNVFFSRYKDTFNSEVCQKLNAVIMVLRNAYIDSIGETWEQPEDFGQLPIEKLFRKYGSAIKKELSNGQEEQPKKSNIDRSNRVGNGYTFDILYSYEDATKYNKYTEPGAWCITYAEHHFNYYVSNLKIHYVIFAKDGFENVKREKGPGWSYYKPQDEYGNSLIALLQSNNGWNPVYITSRWNHGASQDNSRCEADHAYSTEDFFKVTGVNEADLKRIYEIWKSDYKDNTPKDDKPQKKELMRMFKYAQMKLNGGNFENLFGDTECKTVRLMTNNKKMENLNTQAADLGNEVFEKKKQKLLRNSITLNSVNLFNSTYFFIRDGNKILFESIIGGYQRDLNLNWFFSSSDGQGHSAWADRISENKSNVIGIRKPKSGGGVYDHDYVMIYDCRRHTFVEVEGVKKFKHVADVSSFEREKGKGGYYEVANSMVQRALIDINTNMPIVMPNGRSWVENIEYTKGNSINYSRSITTKFYPANKGVIKLEVDTSSGEYYLFDMPTKKFFDPIIPDEISGKTKVSIMREYKLPENYTILAFSSQYGGYKSLYIEGKPVEMLGNIFFNSIKYSGAKDLFLLNLGGKRIFYDKSKDSVIKIPVEDNGGNCFDMHNSLCIDRYLVFDCGNDWRNEKNIIYDINFDQFLKNPLTNDYLFKIYSIGEHRVSVYKDNNYHSGLVIDLETNSDSPELTPSIDENGEVETRSVRVYESSNKLSKSDIRNMIFEVINKLFYK